MEEYEVFKKTMLEKYEVSKKILGKGAQGTVYLIRDKNARNNYFALKVVKKTPSSISEVEIQEQLQPHPNIIPLVETFTVGEKIFMVMEFCQENLYEYIKKRNPISEREILHIFRQIVAAVKYLHDNRIAHRDIKLENVLFCDGKWKLTDFGHATKEKTSLAFVGTLDYLAPEIIKSNSTMEEYETLPVDLWTLGVTLYEMTFFRPPFLRKTFKKTYEAILTEEVSFRERDISTFLKEIITRLLQKNPENRIDIDSLMKLLKNLG